MKIEKAKEIKNAKISFVSLVDKAANKRQFLITKEEDGKANFTSVGQILKAESHTVTGIVYEPMAEDAHGNFMTEEEIKKAAYGFVKSGEKVDLQHCFKELDGAEVVESYIVKADTKINGTPVKKGTWVLTAEITNDDVWKKIEKGEITGLSMGGVGEYATEDVDLEEKEPVEKAEKAGLLSKLASMLGVELVEKGAVKDKYNARKSRDDFYQAWYALEGIIYSWDNKGNPIKRTDKEIKEALSDFVDIATNALTSKSEADIVKSGRTLSAKNKETLKGIYDGIGALLAADTKNEEETEVNEAEVKKMIDTAMEPIAVALADIKKSLTPPAPEAKPVEKEEGAAETTPTREMIDAAVTAAVAKALGVEEEPETKADEPVTAQNLGDVVAKAVEKTLEPVLAARGLSTQINSVQKQEKEPHYLHGVL